MNRTTGQEMTPDEFLKKASPLYYDLEREKLKEFRCEVTSDFLESKLSEAGLKDGFEKELFKMYTGAKYTLVYDLKETKILSAQQRFTDDIQMNQTVSQMNKKVREMLELELLAWEALNVPTLLRPANDGHRKLRLKMTPKGYELFSKDRASQATYFFGPDFKLASLVGKFPGEAPVTLTTEYEATSKGWQIKVCDWVDGKTVYQARITYRNVGGFHLPDKLTIRKGSERVSFLDTVKFDHYQVKR
jgi:hypothetical protein